MQTISHLFRKMIRAKYLKNRGCWRFTMSTKRNRTPTISQLAFSLVLKATQQHQPCRFLLPNSMMASCSGKSVKRSSEDANTDEMGPVLHVDFDSHGCYSFNRSFLVTGDFLLYIYALCLCNAQSNHLLRISIFAYSHGTTMCL